DFDEVADPAAIAQAAAGPKAGIRSNMCLGADFGLLKVAEGFDDAARADLHAAQHAVRADLHAVGQFDLAFEYAPHVNEDIPPAQQAAADVDACRVGQRHAGFQQCVGLLALVDPFEFGLLDAAVHAQRLPLG